MNSFCMVARFKIISDQGAFDGPYERSRTMCFRFELLLQSLEVHAPHFRKSALSKRFADFGRPCRGLSTWKGASPKELWFYMTRRAFLALRVIPVQGKSWSSVAANLLCAKRFGKLVIWRFLEIHKFNFASSAKINYFRSRRGRWCIREVQYNSFSARILQKRNSNLTTKIDDCWEKWSLQAICWF